MGVDGDDNKTDHPMMAIIRTSRIATAHMEDLFPTTSLIAQLLACLGRWPHYWV